METSIGSDRITGLVDGTVTDLDLLKTQHPELTSFACGLQDIIKRGHTIAKLSSNAEQGMKFFHPIVQIASDLLVERMRTHRDYRVDWEKDLQHPFNCSILKDLKMALEQLEAVLRSAILCSPLNS